MTRRATALIVAVALAVVGAPRFAGADDVSVTSTTASSNEAAAPSEGRTSGPTLVSQTIWVRNGEAVQIQIRLPQATDLASSTLSVALHSVVRSRDQFQATLSDADFGSIVAQSVQPVADLAPDSSGAVTVTIGPEQLGSFATQAQGGVYPVSVKLTEAELTSGFTTYIVRVPDGSGLSTFDVAWAQAITAETEVADDGTERVTDAGLRSLRILLAGLDEQAVAVTWVIDAHTLDVLADDPNAADVIDDLRVLVRRGQVVQRGYADVQPEALLDAGVPDDLGLQLDTGADAIEASLGVATSADLWVDDGDVGTPGAEALLDQGITKVVLPESSYEPIQRSITLASPFSLEVGDRRVRAASADADLDARFTDDADALDATQLLAELAVLFFDRPGQARGTVLVPASTWAPTAAFVDTLATGLASSPVLRSRTVTDVLDLPAERSGSTDLVRSTVDDGTRSGAPIDGDAVREARDGLAQLVSVTGDPTASSSGERLVLASEGRGLTDAQRRAGLAVVDVRVRSITSSVRVDQGSYRLTARDGVIPISITNATGQPLTVTVELQSDQLAFEGAESATPGRYRTQVDLIGAQTSLPVAVSVRAPGAFLTFPLEVSVHSSDDRVELDRQVITVHSTAISGVGVGLSVMAVTFLLLWWGREWRRARRRRHETSVAT